MKNPLKRKRSTVPSNVLKERDEYQPFLKKIKTRMHMNYSTASDYDTDYVPEKKKDEQRMFYSSPHSITEEEPEEPEEEEEEEEEGEEEEEIDEREKFTPENIIEVLNEHEELTNLQIQEFLEEKNLYANIKEVQKETRRLVGSGTLERYLTGKRNEYVYYIKKRKKKPKKKKQKKKKKKVVKKYQIGNAILKILRDNGGKGERNEIFEEIKEMRKNKELKTRSTNLSANFNAALWRLVVNKDVQIRENDRKEKWYFIREDESEEEEEEEETKEIGEFSESDESDESEEEEEEKPIIKTIKRKKRSSSFKKKRKQNTEKKMNTKRTQVIESSDDEEPKGIATTLDRNIVLQKLKLDQMKEQTKQQKLRMLSNMFEKISKIM